MEHLKSFPSVLYAYPGKKMMVFHNVMFYSIIIVYNSSSKSLKMSELPSNWVDLSSSSDKIWNNSNLKVQTDICFKFGKEIGGLWETDIFLPFFTDYMETLGRGKKLVLLSEEKHIDIVYFIFVLNVQDKMLDQHY